MKKPVKGVLGVAVVILIAGAGYLGYGHYLRKEPLPEGLIQANGRIEGDHVTIASKYAGRIQELMVKEGDTVKAGEVLATLDDPQIRARVEQARQTAAALDAQLKASQTELEVLKKEVPLAIATAEAGVTHARAVVDQAKAKEGQDRHDAERFRNLYATGTVEKHRQEMADLASTISTKELASARTALVQAEMQLAQAKLGWDKIKAKEEGLVAVNAQHKQAQAAQTEAESVLADFKIVAPSGGTITTRIADAGEVIAAGGPLFDLVDLDRLYLKVYVPENLIGKLRLGLPAKIYTDAYPDHPVDATVKYIASQAEFTPKEVQTPDERVKLVYAAKLYLTQNPEHRLTPGMPADAVIRWQEDVPWVKAQW